MDSVAGRQVSDIYYQEREASIYDLEYRWKTDDIDFWVGLARECAGPNGAVLELGCGTGRVAVPMAEAGLNIVGVDQSPWMIARAKEKYERLTGSAQARLGLLEGDMRTLDLEQKFNLVYIPFNTFLILRTVPDQLVVFDRVRRHLAPDGVFAFEIFVPDVKRLVMPTDVPWTLEVDQTLGKEGLRLQRDLMRRVDPIRQQLLVTYRMREYRDNTLEREWLSDLDLTYIFPRELEHLVARAGYEFVHYWGDYDRTDFWKMQPPARQLPVLRPKE